jgi:hypothetical protein
MWVYSWDMRLKSQLSVSARIDVSGGADANSVTRLRGTTLANPLVPSVSSTSTTWVRPDGLWRSAGVSVA